MELAWPPLTHLGAIWHKQGAHPRLIIACNSTVHTVSWKTHNMAAACRDGDVGGTGGDSSTPSSPSPPASPSNDGASVHLYSPGGVSTTIVGSIALTAGAEEYRRGHPSNPDSTPLPNTLNTSQGACHNACQSRHMCFTSSPCPPPALLHTTASPGSTTFVAPTARLVFAAAAGSASRVLRALKAGAHPMGYQPPPVR